MLALKNPWYIIVEVIFRSKLLVSKLGSSYWVLVKILVPKY